MTGHTDRIDAARDAAALTRAIHDHDHEARNAIINSADHQAVAAILAAILATVLDSIAGCRHCASEMITDWQRWLRTANDGGLDQ